MSISTPGLTTIFWQSTSKKMSSTSFLKLMWVYAPQSVQLGAVNAQGEGIGKHFVSGDDILVEKHVCNIFKEIFFEWKERKRGDKDENKEKPTPVSTKLPQIISEIAETCHIRQSFMELIWYYWLLPNFVFEKYWTTTYHGLPAGRYQTTRSSLGKTESRVEILETI